MNTHIQNVRTFQPTKALLCLGAATLFWFLSALNKPGYTLNVEYPVQFVYDDSLFIPTSPLPRTVQVNVSSDGWGLLRHSWLPFRVDPINYVVKNPLKETVINTVSLAAALAEHVKKLHVNYVVSDTLEMSFDRRLTKTLRLVADSLHINLAPHFVVSSLINLTPRTIEIEGPAKLVRGLPDTLWVKIPRKRIADNYDEELPLNQLRHPLLRTSADRVAVSFEVGELLSPVK
ncbi:YbbR-like domain-containing protein [Spirosoma areae]